MLRRMPRRRGLGIGLAQQIGQRRRDLARAAPRVEIPALQTTLDEQLVAAMEGVVRDERGLRYEREQDD